MSLTAISLLWNAADLLSRLHARPATPAAAAGRAAANSEEAGQALSAEQFEELLRLLLGALQARAPHCSPACL